MNYKDPRWLHKRNAILRHDEYLCQESKRYGKSIEATMVHHIYPVESYPELKYKDWNLISLSESKHNAMHDRDTHKITEPGKYWQDKVRDKFEAWIQSKRTV
jgi:5-methylcytosine-specific restriction protein A